MLQHGVDATSDHLLHHYQGEPVMRVDVFKRWQRPLLAAVTLAIGHSASGNSAIQTTVSCSTSGSVIFSEPAQGASSKQVNIYENACDGTASYTYPIAFTYTPQVLSQSLTTTASATTTAVTITGSTSTGFAELQGW